MTSGEDILLLFERRGHLAYDGEGISQWEHAWQCGQRAAAAGAPPALQLAAWLHDLGHLLSPLDGTPTVAGIDDRHEVSGAGVLEALFGEPVSKPVALHVEAKRFLVTRHPDYLERLSPDSRRSLALQGGPMTLSECEVFAALQYAEDAKRLRSWDEAGKIAGWRPDNDGQARLALRVLMQQVGRTR
jgi:predicted HD phosphohydrolase